MPDQLNGGFESAGASTERILRWSQWWVDHREQARKAWLGVFIALDATLVAYGAWGFIDWLAFGGLREEQAIRQMASAEYGRFRPLTLEEIQVGAPMALPGGAGKTDLLASVENRNSNFWAELEYRFVVGGEALPVRRAFVLPEQAKYLTELGAPAASGAGVELKIERRLWHRAELRGARSAEDFAAERLDLRAENPVHTARTPFESAPDAVTDFKLVNATAFGYYDIDLLVLLYRGEAVVGANKIRIESLVAGEKKPMQVFWYHVLPQVTRVEVLPEINIYDPNAYRTPR